MSSGVSRRRRAPRLGPVPLVAALAAVGACDAAEADRVLQVYAASSLTEAFTELAGTYETAHPDTDVAITFAGSQILRIQIEQGAPADLYASADPAHMQALAEADLVLDASTFALNELVAVVPARDGAVRTFRDLPRAERLVIGTAGVPVGRYAREVLAGARELFGDGFADSVLSSVVSEESNARLVRAKVELGEADAAFVYATDARASTAVRALAVPAELRPAVEYRIAIVASTASGDRARAWKDLLSSTAGREVLERHGFALP